MEKQESLPKPELDLPLPETEIPAQAPSVASEKPSGKTIIAIAVVFLILLTAGVSLAYFLAKNSASKTAEEVAAPTVAPTATPTPDPTANWKTYIDNVGGFELKYPSGWRYVVPTEQASQSSTPLFENRVYVQFSNAPDNEPPSMNGSVNDAGFRVEMYNNAGFFGLKWKNLSSNEFYNVDGAYWKRIDTPNNGGGFIFNKPILLTMNGIKIIYQTYYYNTTPSELAYGYYIFDNGKILSILFDIRDKNSQKNELLKIKNQILSTFKFTNSSNETTKTIPSPDGTKNLIIKSKPIENSSYDCMLYLYLADNQSQNEKMVYWGDGGTTNKCFTIDKNSWSPSGKYFYVSEGGPDYLNIRLFKTNGTAFVDEPGGQNLDVLGLLKYKTGWEINQYYWNKNDTITLKTFKHTNSGSGPTIAGPDYILNPETLEITPTNQ